jgi:alanine dehydrogenase
MKTTIITQQQIEEVLIMPDVISAVEDAYRLYSLKKVQLAPVISIDVEKHHGELDIKSGYEEDGDIIGVKLASGYWDNPEKFNLPSGLATILLIDGRNGVPLAVMDGGLITDMRTGAAGAVSAKYLARPDSKKVAIIGTGMQAKMQLSALSHVFQFDQVFVWGRNKTKAEKYANEMNEKLSLSISVCDSVEQAVSDADIVVTTTPSKAKLIESQWIKPGTHVICIGTDMQGKQEVDEKLFTRSKIIVDSLAQCTERGELQHSLKKQLITSDDVHAEIGDVLLSNKTGRESEEEITIFDSTGLSIQDITTAKMVLKRIEETKGDSLLHVSLI